MSRELGPFIYRGAESSHPSYPAFIETATIHFILEAVDPLILPVYKGSTFRGAFGRALRHISCKTGAENCRDCRCRDKCDFSYLFDTPSPLHPVQKRYAEAAPHPYVIEPPLEEKVFYQPGDRLGLNLVLIGRGIAYSKTFVSAIEAMGELGMGKKRISGGRICVQDMRSYAGRTDPTRWNPSLDLPIRRFPLLSEAPDLERNEHPSVLSLFFATPTRFCVENRPISESHFTFELFIRNLVRRVSLVHTFHAAGGALEPDLGFLIRPAESVRVVMNNLNWYDWDRYSSRQKNHMTLGGFVGSVELSGELGEFIPLLNVGEAIHVGKNTSLGMGKYLLTLKDAK